MIINIDYNHWQEDCYEKLLTLVSIILFAIALTACGNDKSGNSYDSKKTVTIKNTYEFKDKNNTHHRGETKTDTVKVPYNPNRVAVLDYGALDVMKQLGLQNKIVSIAKVKEIHFYLPH